MNDAVQQSLECVIHETAPNPRHAVIWLHGLGADGNDFAPIVPQLRQAARRPLRFVFPHAPVRPVTINGGMAMRAWYDILGVDIARDEDTSGIADSLRRLAALVDHEIKSGILPEHLILAGFSQGGAIALRAGLAQRRPVAGVLALSCYLLQAERFNEWARPESRQVPIFMGHGTQDPVVPVQLGQRSAELLQAAGYDVEWATWPMPHAVCPEEIQAIDHWLDRRFRQAR